MCGIGISLYLFCYAMTMSTSPGQTLHDYIFTSDPQRDTEVKSSFLSSTKVFYNDTIWTTETLYPFVVPEVEPKAEELNTSELIDCIVESLIEPQEIIKEVCTEELMSGLTYCNKNFNDKLQICYLLFPVIQDINNANTYIKQEYPEGHYSLCTSWVTLLQLLLLFACWISALVYGFGICFTFRVKQSLDGQRLRYKLRPEFYQPYVLVPRVYRYAPGLPRSFVALSMLILNLGMAHAIKTGSLKFKKPKIRYKSVTLHPKDVDPVMAYFVRKEYTTAKVDAAVFGRIPHKRYKSFKEF